MSTFVINIIHRPEMVPEYAEKVTGHGQTENIGRKALLTERLDIFKLQQQCAHENGLKTTIQMTYAACSMTRLWRWPRSIMRSMATRSP